MNQRQFFNRNVAYTGPGKMINSGDWNGLDIKTAKEVAINAVETGNFGTKKFLIDYEIVGLSKILGCPIPIIHCSNCGIVPVPEEELPVKLPEDEI